MKRLSSKALLVLAGLVLAVLPARSESRMEKSFSLEPGGRLSLETEMGRVTVTGKAGSGARLVVTSRRDLDELLSFRFDSSPSSLTVSARRKRRWWFGDRGASVQYTLEVPAETSVNIDTSGGGISLSGTRSDARLETSGGRIEVADLVGDLEGDTSGGGIRLSNIKGRIRVETSGGGIVGVALDGAVQAETSGGSVRLERVSGDIKAHSSGGGIRIAEAGGRVDADTSGGGIEASFLRGNSHGGVLETSGGGITVSVDPQADLEIDAQGSSVKTELPLKVSGEISRRRIRGTLGRGGATLRMRTSGGGVRIQPL